MAAASAGAGDRLGTGDPPGPGLPETARTARARRRGARSTGRMRGGVRRRRPRAAGWEGIRELNAISESSGRRGGLGSGSEGQGSTAAAPLPLPVSLCASPLFLGGVGPGRWARAAGIGRPSRPTRRTSRDHPTVRIQNTQETRVRTHILISQLAHVTSKNFPFAPV
jgi:hypothetical protein